MPDIDGFNDNLQITQQYCEQQLLQKDKSDAQIFRSIDPENCKNLEPEGYLYLDFVPGLYDSQLAFKQNNIKELLFSNVLGRILVCELAGGLLEGCCEANSDGFIDSCDLPPIDTWFYLSDDKKLLYSWIPEKFVAIADICIEVSSTAMFWWMKWNEEIL